MPPTDDMLDGDPTPTDDSTSPIADIDLETEEALLDELADGDEVPDTSEGVEQT